MPEIKSDPQPEEEKQEKENEGVSQEELDQIIADFEAKIESGQFSGKSFHAVVKEELYPLIGEETMGLEQFTRLVQKWANKNYPHDWPSRAYIFDEASQN